MVAAARTRAASIGGAKSTRNTTARAPPGRIREEPASTAESSAGQPCTFEGGLPCRAMPTSLREMYWENAFAASDRLSALAGVRPRRNGGYRAEEEKPQRASSAARNIIRPRLLRSGGAMQARSTRRNTTSRLRKLPFRSAAWWRQMQQVGQRAAVVHLTISAARRWAGLNLAAVLPRLG
jgi:hypothetical protein